MRGRPLLYTDYELEQALLPTTTKRVGVAVLLVLAVLLPLHALRVPGFESFLNFSFLGDGGWLLPINRALIFLIGALGLNILTGLAGQVSIGHAFFMGLGAYTAAALGGHPEGVWGLGLPIWIWLPAAGIVAALVGVVVAPTAVRVRGLYLAIVTLGLVFIGEHIFRNLNFITGPAELGRTWPPLELALWREGSPTLSFATDGEWLGIAMSEEAKAYFFLLILAIGFTILAKNLARTRIGRSFAAIRDRDIAAEIMGVAEAKAKTQAFAISSFYAGVAGALLGSLVGRLIPETWNLFLSVQFVAIVLIGGAGTITGVILGSFFVVLLPKIVEEVTNWLAQTSAGDGILALFANLVIKTEAGDFGIVSTAAQGPGLSIFQVNTIIYGLLIAAFLIFEPLGLFGIWIRIRNYWKGWPFTY